MFVNLISKNTMVYYYCFNLHFPHRILATHTHQQCRDAWPFNFSIWWVNKKVFHYCFHLHFLNFQMSISLKLLFCEMSLYVLLFTFLLDCLFLPTYSRIWCTRNISCYKHFAQHTVSLVFAYDILLLFSRIYVLR